MRLGLLYNSPFLYIIGLRNGLKIAFFVGGFVYIFLLLFEPFGIGDIQKHKTFFVLGYGFISFIVSFFSFIFLPKWLPKFFNENEWTVLKTTFFIMFQLLIIAIINWYYTAYIGKGIVTRIPTLLSFLFYTIAIGIFPVFFLLLLAENYLYKKNSFHAKQISKKLKKEKNTKEDVNVKLGKNKETHSFLLSELLFVKAEGNYCELYLYKQAKILKILLRITISEMDEKLKYLDVKRCHKSYIVNFQNVYRVTGNARNYNLELSNVEQSIPVSRQFSRQFINHFKSKGH